MTDLGLFVAASLGVLLVPGPAVTFVVARSLEQGTWGGLAATIGLGAGGMAHVVAAAVGLTAVLAGNPMALGVLKMLGAGYLIFLGVKALRPAGPGTREHAVQTEGLARLAWEGFVVNLTNPKAALFFLAFLPQFVDAASGPVAPQLVRLGCLFVALAVITDAGYAVLAGSLGRRISEAPEAVSRRRRYAGVVYIGLGLTAAFASR